MGTKQTLLGLAFAVLAFATSYLGYDKYQASQVIVTAPDITTNVAITSLPAGAMRSNADISAMIKTVVDAKMKAHIEDSGRH